MPLGMETDPLPSLFRALEHLKAKVLGRTVPHPLPCWATARTKLETGMFSQLASASHRAGREKSRALFTQGLFDFLGRFWSYFPSQADCRGEPRAGSGTQLWPQSHWPLENSPQTLGDKRTLGHERSSRGRLHRLKTGRRSWIPGPVALICKLGTSRGV